MCLPKATLVSHLVKIDQMVQKLYHFFYFQDSGHRQRYYKDGLIGSLVTAIFDSSENVVFGIYLINTSPRLLHRQTWW